MEDENKDDFQSENVDLSEFDDEFEEAELSENDFDPVPDGKYQVNVERVELTRAKSSGSPMLKWSLKIIAPKFQGRFLWRNNVIATRENIKYLKSDLYACGLELQKLSELQTRLEELLDVKLEVTKRTKGENENVYINKRLQLEDASEEECSSVKGGDDMPF